MDNNNSNVQTSSTMGVVGQIIGRLIAAAVILGVTAFFTPGFIGYEGNGKERDWSAPTV